ncbi:hypothetical protein [Nocardioides sp. cx-173]|uniref:hypothetical protein n=1 Tax=Nocardioides sp. cx-173 TaxID=2898796 RepID=UPI001E489657|nr:hypothetical protein [Nocardioides sp. cx-173]MCD4524241.1 hypothetical protein [Nocardioides sp. cx-173]UGB41633.1 hypothetical protein LQ940_20040 [Nocardioides sp. cx-173]
MAEQLQVGQALTSAVDSTAVIVTRAPTGEVDLTCGGVAMAKPGEGASGATPDPALAGETKLGKRYVDEADTIEVLCTKPGQYALALNGQVLDVRTARPLPASD